MADETGASQAVQRVLDWSGHTGRTATFIWDDNSKTVAEMTETEYMRALQMLIKTASRKPETWPVE